MDAKRNPAGRGGASDNDVHAAKLNGPEDRQAHTQTQLVPLARIKDGGAQMRVEMSIETVNDYASDMLSGAAFPPVVLYDDGCDLWIGDGFHRVAASRKADRETITAVVKQGSARDAILYGASSNAAHGLRRTQAD